MTWTYVSGSTFHSVTANDGSFDSSPNCPQDVNACLHPGASYTHRFAAAGTFAYHCRVHGLAMSGTVIVRAASTSPPPTTGGGGGGSGGGGGAPLPNTGSDPSTVPFMWLGLALLVTGGAALFVLRRRAA